MPAFEGLAFEVGILKEIDGDNLCRSRKKQAAANHMQTITITYWFQLLMFLQVKVLLRQAYGSVWWRPDEATTLTKKLLVNNNVTITCSHNHTSYVTKMCSFKLGIGVNSPKQVQVVSIHLVYSESQTVWNSSESPFFGPSCTIQSPQSNEHDTINLPLEMQDGNSQPAIQWT